MDGMKTCETRKRTGDFFRCVLLKFNLLVLHYNRNSFLGRNRCINFSTIENFPSTVLLFSNSYQNPYAFVNSKYRMNLYEKTNVSVLQFTIV